MSGTDLAYTTALSLRTPYAKSGTEISVWQPGHYCPAGSSLPSGIACPAGSVCSGTSLSYLPTRCLAMALLGGSAGLSDCPAEPGRASISLRACYSMSGTDTAYGPV
eukprot:3935714-Rhodomonas_salina.3